MKTTPRLRRTTDHSAGVRRHVLLAGATLALLLAACAGETGPGWTFAPLQPTPTADTTPGGTPGAGTPGTGTPGAGTPGAGTPGAGTPAAGTPGTGNGVTFDVETPADQPLAFIPNSFSVAAGGQVTVNYLNNSNLPHNINFFAGPDPSAPSIAATEIVTGPDALESVTFSAPDEPGDYFFHCDVHPVQMQGTMTVQP